MSCTITAMSQSSSATRSNDGPHSAMFLAFFSGSNVIATETGCYSRKPRWVKIVAVAKILFVACGPLQLLAGGGDDAGDDRATRQVRQRARLAHPDQRAG